MYLTSDTRHMKAPGEPSCVSEWAGPGGAVGTEDGAAWGGHSHAPRSAHPGGGKIKRSEEGKQELPAPSPPPSAAAPRTSILVRPETFCPPPLTAMVVLASEYFPAKPPTPNKQRYGFLLLHLLWLKPAQNTQLQAAEQTSHFSHLLKTAPLGACLLGSWMSSVPLHWRKNESWKTKVRRGHTHDYRNLLAQPPQKAT